MGIKEAFETAEAILKPYTRLATRPAPDRLDITILPNAVPAAVWALVYERWGYLTAITGLDRSGTTGQGSEEVQWARLAGESETASPGGAQEGAIEILYHFCQGEAILTLRTSVRYSFPVVHSICEVIPSATLYERELGEMFGVKVVGTPVKDKLLLPEDWPDGVFPLRKIFKSPELPPPGKED